MARAEFMVLVLLAAVLAATHAWGHDDWDGDYGYDHHGGYGHDHDDDYYDDDDVDDDDVDGYHKSAREFHSDIDGNVLHNNVQYDHIDNAADRAHLEHEKRHHHEHTPRNDLDERDFHEDIVTPEERHDVEEEVVETHHVRADHEPAHHHFGSMLDHGDMVDRLHDPATDGQGHEVGIYSEGPANGHDDEEYW